MKSVREELSEAFDAAVATEKAPEAPAPVEASGGEAGGAGLGIKDAPTAQPEQASQPSTEGERPRGPDGKFIKAEGKPEETPAVVPAEKPAETPAAAPQITPETPPADRPPDGLTAGIKAQWASLPAEIKAEFSKREEDFHKGIAQYREGYQFAQGMQQLIQPYLPMIQAQGVHPAQAIGTLLQTAYNLQTNPVETLASLARSYNIDLSQLAPQPGQQADPTVAALQRKLMETEQRLGQIQQQITQPVYDQRLREVQAVENNPANVYFKDVFPTMVNLIKSGEATGAQDAYDKACRVNPQVWSAIQAQQQKSAEAKRIEEARKQADAAKRAALDVTGTGTAGTAKPDESLRQELERRWG